MGGGLMQLVAYGAQDIYLTGNPQITYFKTVYRRHTNFSMESIEQVWCGDALCGRATSTISRNGDLVYKLYLQQTINVINTKESKNNVSEQIIKNGGAFVYNPTHTGIELVEVEIGGQMIDRQSGKWMEVYSQLTEPNSGGNLGIVGPNTGTKFQNMSRGGGVIVTSFGSVVDKVGSGQSNAIVISLDDINEDTNTKFDAYVPLRFWFCINPGLALPLIALQYHEVKVNIVLKKDATDNNALCLGNKLEYECNRLFADYIYLDTDERRRFAQVSHEYLIEQIQHQKFLNTGGDLNLNFNHPVKEIIWTGGQNDRTGLFGRLPGGTANYKTDDYYLDKLQNNNITYQLILNGQERMSARPLEYYTKQQVYDYHTGTPVGSGDSYTIEDISCITDNEPSISFYSNNTTQKQEEFVKPPAIQTIEQDKYKQAILQTGLGQASNDAIAVYSFSLKPEEHQPSGTCNFSRIDNARLVINNAPNVQVGDNNHCCCDEYDIYAINYNVLRIMSGMGGLAYSN